MKSAKYITTPIYYVNDVPHIGHAYTDIAADVWARFMRLDGHPTHFLTGTDEHGQKIEKAAQAANQDPQAFVDQVSERFRALTPLLNLSNDDFIRTTEDRHKKSVQHLWDVLVANGQIYEGAYEGWYAIRDEAFYAESELVEGKAPTGAPVEWVKEPSYFFKLSAWQEPLLNFIENNPSFIVPETRRNEVISFIKGGLKDLSVSRTSFKWGVPVPNDDRHIMYVWIDALTNYITALGYPHEQDPKFQQFWPQSVHVIGKDILRFHAVYWPAFLLAAGLTPPHKIVAHGWWTSEGQKISKSLGNVINPVDLVETYGLDPIRYFVMREVPFGQDGDFSKASLIRRINVDLSNDLGNLCQRVLSMVAKNAEGKIPPAGELTPRDKDLLALSLSTLERVRDHMDHFQFHRALEDIWRICGEANKYVDEQAPWALRKTDIVRMNTVLHVLIEIIRDLGILIQPFMPESAAKILDLVALPISNRTFDTLGVPLQEGTGLPPPSAIFPRIEVAESVSA